MKSPVAELASIRNPAHVALREIVRANALIRRAFEPRLADHGLSLAQWGILRALERREFDGAPAPRVTELGELLLIRPPSTSGVVDRLSRMGLVAKFTDRGDRRTRRVRLTSAGRRRVERVLDFHPSWIEHCIAPLSLRERTELARLLQRLTAHLASLGAERSDSLHEAARASRRLHSTR